MAVRISVLEDKSDVEGNDAWRLASRSAILQRPDEPTMIYPRLLSRTR